MSADQALQDIADYVIDFKVESEEALNTARNCLIDTIGCGLLALKYPNCTRHLGPLVPGTTVENGARVFGKSFELDPVKAAWDIGALVRWLDFNDTWLAEEWGHPSDNLGAIMALSDYISRVNIANHKSPLSIRDVLEYMIKAHEIQGILALENSFNKVGLDHVLLVRVASTAVATHMLGGTREQIIDALSQAWADGSSLRAYRHAPNAGSRKSWAAGDATSRAVRLAMITMAGEMGMPSILSSPEWGFYDVSFKGREFSFSKSYGTYVMENILFKISFPAEFHAQTAVECAVLLYPEIKEKLNEIERIEVTTHESALRIIDKTGALDNPADRDHCMQYMLAVAMIKGDLVAEFYEDSFHQQNSLIDKLRNKMILKEDKRYSKDYLADDKRSIANALQIFFKDGSQTDKVEVEYPIGHRNRRQEGIPLLERKFFNSLKSIYSKEHSDRIYSLCLDKEKTEQTPVNEFMDMFVLKD
ncbi:bifunctional 2-methylcitrate dehydratase/aconitate hydratase [Candidatus Thioglobus sp.]|nr:bifunctional 2-methylcitrate dehydratase/aconitate hydratase [Candidatus Thioglobus sp.]MDC1027080.1 bifunctional 2-methylcitrate dehydratase/aconitate hydratase [Candidatus Thioglobus sp.]